MDDEKTCHASSCVTLPVSEGGLSRMETAACVSEASTSPAHGIKILLTGKAVTGILLKMVC